MNTKNKLGLLYKQNTDVPKPMTTTPISLSRNLSQQMNCNVWLKLELCHLTGSHKDRESQLVVAECVKQGYSALGCATTGNYGLSLAYFAWLSGIEFHVWAMSSISTEVVCVLKSFNATIHFVDEPFSALVKISSKCLEYMNAMDANPGKCLLKIHAHRSTAEEIQQQVPTLSKVVVPVNNGSLLLGLASNLPEEVDLYGVTSNFEGATSINGLCCAEGKEQVMSALSQRNGRLIRVSEDEITFAQKSLNQEGVAAEVSSASVIAALPHISLHVQEHICCVITGKRDKLAQLQHLKKQHEQGW